MKNNEYISNAVSFSKRIERVAREERMRESLQPPCPSQYRNSLSSAST